MFILHERPEDNSGTSGGLYPTLCLKQNQLCNQTRLLWALSNQVLKTSSNGDCPTSLDNPLQCWIVLNPCLVNAFTPLLQQPYLCKKIIMQQAPLTWHCPGTSLRCHTHNWNSAVQELTVAETKVKSRIKITSGKKEQQKDTKVSTREHQPTNQ